MFYDLAIRLMDPISGEFENWLEENCSKGGKNLKSLLSALARNVQLDK